MTSDAMEYGITPPLWQRPIPLPPALIRSGDDATREAGGKGAVNPRAAAGPASGPIAAGPGHALFYPDFRIVPPAGDAGSRRHGRTGGDYARN